MHDNQAFGDVKRTTVAGQNIAWIGWPGSAVSATLAPRSGVPVRCLAAIHTLLKPIHYFSLNPSDPVGAEDDPQWEIPGLLKPRDMLR